MVAYPTVTRDMMFFIAYAPFSLARTVAENADGSVLIESSRSCWSVWMARRFKSSQTHVN